MIEVLLIALALSADAFAVSLGLGTKNEKALALKTALCFGFFQGFMSFVGFLAGDKIGEFEIGKIAAFSLLFLVGCKMIYGSFKDEEKTDASLSFYALLMLGIATSIDALAVGLTLTLLSVKPLISICIIAAVTFIVSYLGVKIGEKGAQKLGSKAEIAGGLILIFISLKLLAEHFIAN